jgi:hypothetical protein
MGEVYFHVTEGTEGLYSAVIIAEGTEFDRVHIADGYSSPMVALRYALYDATHPTEYLMTTRKNGVGVEYEFTREEALEQRDAFQHWVDEGRPNA